MMSNVSQLPIESLSSQIETVEDVPTPISHVSGLCPCIMIVYFTCQKILAEDV